MDNELTYKIIRAAIEVQKILGGQDWSSISAKTTSKMEFAVSSMDIKR